jgi:Ca2+-binding EF-hand superfamily protein
MLPEEKIAEIKEAFSIQDVENEGKIDGLKLMGVLRTLGHDPTKAEIKDLLNELGKTESNKIEFEEILIIYERKGEDLERTAAVRIAFRMFDDTEKGYITPEDVVRVMEKLGSPISNENAEKLVRSSSLYGYGKVNFEEFLVKQFFL